MVEVKKLQDETQEAFVLAVKKIRLDETRL